MHISRTIIASSLIAALVISVMPFSFSSNARIVEVQKVHAQGGAISSIGGCIAQLVAGGLSSYFSVSVPTTPGSLNAKECLDGVMKGIANEMKQRLLDSTIQWAKTGFEGDPLFIVNERRYLQEVADEQALSFINEFGRVAGSASRVTTERARNAAEERFENQFSSGGGGSNSAEFGIPNCRVAQCSPDQEEDFEAVANMYQRAYPNAGAWQLANDNTLEIRNCPQLPGSAEGGCNSDELQLYYPASAFRDAYASSDPEGFDVDIDIDTDETVRNVERALVEDERRTFRDTVRCRLCEDYDEREFYNSFEGGWDAWFKSAEPGSNPFGLYITTSSQLAQQKRAATSDVSRQADRGSGFLPSRACVERVTIPDDGRVGSGGSYCKSYEVETPGQTISNAVNNSTDSDIRQLELADELNEVFSAIIQGLITRVATEGLRSAGDGSSSYRDPFAGGSSSSSGNTSGSTNQNTGNQSATRDFTDSFNPGRTAQADTQRAVPSGIPARTGEGLTGGATALEQSGVVGAPATVNLDNESFVDWMYFGLTSNFGLEVERKNIPSPQIGQSTLNIPISSGVTLVAPDAGFNFSWSNGYPQRQGSGESQGLGITTEGESVEFSVAGGDREQELTIYAGATQARGQLRISFPGSGEDDIVFTIENTNNATAQAITIKFNAQADESLNVSYQAQELFFDVDAQGDRISNSAYIGLYAATIEDTTTLYLPEEPTLVNGEGLVVLSGGSSISQTGPQTFEGLLGGSWWPGQESTTVDIGDDEYISVPFRTREDFSENGRVVVSGATTDSTTRIVVAAISKYPGDFQSMYETGRQNDRHCLAARAGSADTLLSRLGQIPAASAELYWHMAIPPIVGDSSVSSSCQLKPNTQYYLNILCRRVSVFGNDANSCSDVSIQTLSPGSSQQGGERLRVRTQ